MSRPDLRTRLLVEYAGLVLKQIENQKLSSGESKLMEEIREFLKLEHEEILREIKTLTTGTISR